MVGGLNALHAFYPVNFVNPVKKNQCEKDVQLNLRHFGPLYLPPYTPDLIPIERVCLLIKPERIANFYANDHEHHIEHLDKTLIRVMQHHTENSKTCPAATNN